MHCLLIKDSQLVWFETFDSGFFTGAIVHYKSCRYPTHLVSDPLLCSGKLLLYIVLQFHQLTVVHLLSSVWTENIHFKFVLAASSQPNESRFSSSSPRDLLSRYKNCCLYVNCTWLIWLQRSCSCGRSALVRQHMRRPEASEGLILKSRFHRYTLLNVWDFSISSKEVYFFNFSSMLKFSRGVFKYIVVINEISKNFFWNDRTMRLTEL